MVSLVATVCLLSLVPAQDSGFSQQRAGVDARLRGVSVVDRSIAWISGSEGTVARTMDGGKSWIQCRTPGPRQLDYRDVHALDAQTAWVLSIGEGELSRIYKTTDGGENWTLQYLNKDPKVFLDAISFWDRAHGIALGDPVDGKYTILTTDDGGANWKKSVGAGMPASQPREGAFAASGTCLFTYGDRFAWFGTGGSQFARVFRSSDRGRTWAVVDTTIKAGNDSSGIFSVAFKDENVGVAVGGDYKNPDAKTNTLTMTEDGGRTWRGVAVSGLGGYRSAVAYLSDTSLVAVGPTGADVSSDGGKSWQPFGQRGYHAIALAQKGGWAVGEKGAIGHFSFMNTGDTTGK